MYSYEGLKIRNGTRVPQTVDSPIMVFELFEISDVFISIGIVLVCGVLLYAWWTMMLLLVLFLGVGPIMKRKHPKGVFLHYPHRKFGMSLPGIINPGINRRYSD